MVETFLKFPFCIEGCDMIARTPFVGACPCCSGRYVFARPLLPRRAAVAPLSRRPTAKATARWSPGAPRTGPFRAFATAIHDDEFLKHNSHDAGSTTGHAPETNARGHRGRRQRRDRDRDREHHHVVHVWPASANPTPYEIFGQPKSAAYQKKRFYDLVKQYHPDMYHAAAPSHLRGLSTAVLLERYRLIVAANDILSHTGRRRMYDLYGMGWEQHQPGGGGADGHKNSNISPQAERAWRTRPGHAAYNATWEDWERWRQENGSEPTGDSSGAKQAEQFMSNGGFAVVVLVLVFLGGWGQLTRASTNGASMLAMRDQHHEAISSALREQQTAIAPLNRQDRVGSFLERREGWGYETPRGKGGGDEDGVQ